LDKPLVVGGDFNFKSLGRRLPSEVLATEHPELEAIEEFQSIGFSLAWQRCHPGEPLAQTLRWAKKPTVPFHCDGFLVRNVGDAGLACDVICNDSGIMVSDHNPVVLEFTEALPNNRLHRQRLAR